MLGIYIHVPFCAKKCPYCDFYSVPWRIPSEEGYLSAVKRDILHYQERRLPADTLYFGGGTPSLIRPRSIAEMISSSRKSFLLAPDAEITLECNPCTVTPSRAAEWKEAGVNRVSLGMQSASGEELKLLGRRHSADTTADAVRMLRQAGIDNISLDIMLALPHQTIPYINATIDFAASLRVQHISAYLLQIEPGTPFASSEEIRYCPDDDTASDMYLNTVERLAGYGYGQYEISNFALPGYESRHNSKYWNSEDYLGFGPAAHSFFEGKRFFCPADLSQYCESGKTIPEPGESDAEEYGMLRLRLTDGLYFDEYAARGGDSERLQHQCRKYQNTGLILLKEDRISLTPRGFLLSNALIADLLE